MSATECVREREILDAIAEGRWPRDASADLTAHAATCPVCADLALAASALHDDAATVTAAPMVLPSAGQVWWRAELRARHDAVRLAQRPLIAVQGVAAVVFVAAVLTGLRTLAPDAWAWLVRTASAARRADIATLDTWTLVVVLCVAMWLILAPLAVYAIVRADRQESR